ncbi:hypothetical protein TNCV_776591 [Trichonephila clavipes]|nr:hypothetical protein TNCV_776591 [Trichonephila clavipes]
MFLSVYGNTRATADISRNFDPWLSEKTTPEGATTILISTAKQHEDCPTIHLTCISFSARRVFHFTIICPPLQCLKPVSSANPMPSTSSSMSTISTSSLSIQAHLLSSLSAIMPTMQSESLLPMPFLTCTTTSPSNNPNTSASSLSTEVPPVLTSANKFAALSTEVEPSVSLPESAAPASNDEHFNTSQISKPLKQKSKNRRKRTKVQKPEIEINMAKHKPRKSASTEYTTDDEDMLMYDVEEELEPDPTDKFVLKEYPTNFPK